LRPYLTGARVSIIGDDSTASNPRRFVIRAGAGAQPFDATAQLTFGGAVDAPVFGLAAPTSVGPQQFTPSTFGADGDVVDAAGNYVVPAAVFRGNAAAKTGVHALEDVDMFNVLAIPDAPRLSPDDVFAVYTEATGYVEQRRAMLLVDIPANVNQIDQMQTWMADNDGLRHPNAAVYFPRTYIPDALNQNRLRGHASSGTIAGLWARTDAQRGVWKAPAGTEAQLRGVNSLTRLMSDLENGVLNPLGINCLRNFPIYSNICWGARTLEGADQLASEWKYVPVRRTTLFIEESLYRGTKWVVFEPNDEPLWAQIRLNVGAFMQDLFRKGAFQGSNPKDAYFVRCDGTTTTQTDIDNGIVNIEVGFAPLKPAEFVILKIQQIARQTGA
jgi:phage tail sheath protein FI